MEQLTDVEATALAPACLPVLFETWGGADGRHRPYAADLELTRLGLLAGDAGVVAASAGDAVRGLVRFHDNRAAVTVGERALALLDAGGRLRSSRLLLAMIDPLGTLGEVGRVDTLLTQLEARLNGDSGAGANLDQAELRSLLLHQGRRLDKSGRPAEAEAKFRAMAELAAAG